jgi:hypothetical protein
VGTVSKQEREWIATTADGRDSGEPVRPRQRQFPSAVTAHAHSRKINTSFIDSMLSEDFFQQRRQNWNGPELASRALW